MTNKLEHPKEEVQIKKFLDKIVVNAGVGRASQSPQFADKILPQIDRDLAAITGQKAQVRKAVKSISGFKLREGQTVGLRVTLRGQKMVDFFERLVRIVLPRVRDFAGLELSSVDQGGVLNIGLKEQYVFSEILPETSPVVFSLGISVVPRQKNHDQAIKSYRALNVPLKK